MTSRKLSFSARTVTVLPRVGHADLDALAGDLDAAAGRDPPLHGGGRLGAAGGPGQADALQPVPLARRDVGRAGTATARRPG